MNTEKIQIIGQFISARTMISGGIRVSSFIAQVKAGKRCIIIAKNYVVIDRGSYDRLTKADSSPAMGIWYDEAIEL